MINTTMLARDGDPSTSFDAAQRTVLFAASHRSRILAALRQGATTPAGIAEITGLTVVQIDRRLPELQNAGLAAVLRLDGKDVRRGGYRVWEAL